MTRAIIPPGYGYLNDCTENQGDLVFSGWLLLLDGPFDRHDVLLPSGERITAKTSDKPELAKALAHIPNAGRGYFYARVPLPELKSGETFELTVLGVRGEQDVAYMTVGYHRPPQPQVFPPTEVMQRATGNTGNEYYLATGIKACNDFRRYLAPHIELDGIKSLLDWGCGAGRVTRHLIDRFAGADLYGNDIDSEAVAWAAEHLNGKFETCGLGPPLDYSDSKFDLVISLSVFTHLTEQYQQQWLQELRRVIRPGGILLATTHGEFAGRWWFRVPGEFKRVFKTGFFDGIKDHNLGDVAGGDYYKATFQSRAYTEKKWGLYFELLDYIEGGMNNFQNVCILRNSKSRE